MRVIVLVPSWTETLIEAGVEVVGRTRFCIHPADKVQKIAVVGGTKNIDIQKMKLLNPDLVILDREENTLEISEDLTTHGISWMATHVVSLESCAEELKKMSELFNLNSKLLEMSDEYFRILNSDFLNLKIDVLEPKKINYVIWKNPWMCVGRNTFIGDVLSRFQIKLELEPKKYFEISKEELKKSYCLFSSEPYPFEKEFEELKRSGFQGQIIDGESISWFGVRNLKFMKSYLTDSK
jgi:ABC-type Fe3+-hydroxamate transport system substrate-binding protein